ncbi:hypothetical protein ACFL27_24320 [candidate division CSSED10-310 bacterium]|uniref:Uncharacterized protein n=1 Tax=candidate division CSSED10-310 bacterium TaxID=2855610 RepID=A0ABV6Z4Q7_UNCC1
MAEDQPREYLIATEELAMIVLFTQGRSEEAINELETTLATFQSEDVSAAKAFSR